MIVVLTGGTGGAKLIEGLAAEIDPADLTIICNTGDDSIFHGLYVSPDIDTITYTLAGVVDPDHGWGIKDDTFNALNQLCRMGANTWFKLGDKDLATHITRTRYLREGLKLSDATKRIRGAFGINSRILPMSDDRVETRVHTRQGEISFQEFFVKLRCAPDVTAVHFHGIESSEPAPDVLDAIHQANTIIVCPSNPITSIGPILAVPGIRSTLAASRAPIIGVSPLIRATAVSGPAHKLLVACGFEASAYGVARCYADFLDTLIIAEEDQSLVNRMQELNINVVCTNIRMATFADKRRLAREVLALAKK
jgi:LPPG:FO 2-phospho-L-lactate transferase